MRDEFYHMPIGARIDRSHLNTRIVRLLARPMGLTGSMDTWLTAAREIDPARPAGRLIGDSANRRWVAQVGEQAPGPTWMVEFTHRDRPALHCAEIPFLFGVESGPVAEHLNGWLSDFAHGRAPGWPGYSPEDGRWARRVDLSDGSVTTVEDPLRMVREAFLL